MIIISNLSVNNELRSQFTSLTLQPERTPLDGNAGEDVLLNHVRFEDMIQLIWRCAVRVESCKRSIFEEHDYAIHIDDNTLAKIWLEHPIRWETS